VQRRRRVVHREQGAPVALDDVAVHVGDRQAGGEAPQRVAPKRHQQPRADDLELGVEEGQVVGDLVRARIAVAGWPRLDDVRDEDVLAGHARLAEQLVEDGAGPAHEGAALGVLVGPRRLADDDDERCRAALAGHEVGRPLADLEAAGDVAADLVRDRVEQPLRPGGAHGVELPV
jgi:hypothetical protein